MFKRCGNRLRYIPEGDHKMKEVYGNLWTYPAGVKVITTNGTVKKDGTAVMGRGCALEALTIFGKGISILLGAYLQHIGNYPHILRRPVKPIPPYEGNNFKDWLVSFPVKHHWKERADLELIKISAHRLLEMADKYDWKTIVMPRPGCGNGGLKWENVKPVIEPILDDRFYVITHTEDK